MEYEVYRKNDATDAEFQEISDFFKNIMQEDKMLCNGAQQNLNAGIFMNGALHPRVEKVQLALIIYHWKSIANLATQGPLYFQKLTRDLVTDHYKAEGELGAEIWPAVPKHKVTPMVQADIDLCGALECAASKQMEDLAW